MHGDELRLRYMGELHKHWSGVGHVIKIPDSILDCWCRVDNLIERTCDVSVFNKVY